MNKDLIETFLTVSKVKNISKAANLLYVSQETVSYRLKILEDKVGAILVIRNKGIKRAELTLAGQNFLPLAQNWFNLNSELEDFCYRPQVIELSIGTVNSVNNYLFSGFYNKLKNDPLDWRLTIKTMHTEELYEQVALNTVDVGFPLSHISHKQITIKKVHSEKLMVISRKPIASKKVLMPGDLDGDKQIYINWGSTYRHWHSRYFPSYIKPKFAVDTAKIALDLLDEDSWFFAPYSICLNLRKQQGIVISALAVETPARELFMIYDPSLYKRKRREIVLFQWRILHYIREQEKNMLEMVRRFYTENQLEYVFDKDYL